MKVGSRQVVEFAMRPPCLPRTGRPRTGRTPNISLRIIPDAYLSARVEAVKARKTVGQWLEEAIREKIEREGSDE